MLLGLRVLSLHGGTPFFVMSCMMCQSCFTDFRAKTMMAVFRLRSAGAISANIGS